MGINQLDWNIGGEQPNIEQVEAAKQKEYETDVLFLKTFSTPTGKQVLEWLVTHTLDSPTWWPTQPKEFGYFREGQNSLMRQIKKKIQNAKDYQEKR